MKHSSSERSAFDANGIRLFDWSE